MSIEDKSLDSSQKAAASSKSPRTRIIASAGSGKTLTILSSIIDDIRSGAKSKEILLLAFNSFVREDIRKRIKNISSTENNKKIKEQLELLDNQIHTFHSFCLQCLNDSGDEREEHKTLLSSKNQSGYNEENFISQIIQKKLLATHKDRKLVREFFSEYLGIDSNNLKTYKISARESTDEFLKFQRTIATNIFRIVHGERKQLYVRSHEEKMIAEWLNQNSYKFVYEDENNTLEGYPGIPDFHIILHTKDIHTGKKQKTSIWYEHFGLNKELQPNPNYTASEQENYKKGYLKKIKFIQKNQSNKNNKFLITYSYDFQQRDGSIFKKISSYINDYLKNNDRELLNGEGDYKDDKEYFTEIKMKGGQNEFSKFTKLVVSFMNNYRIRELNYKQIEKKINLLDDYEKRRSHKFFDLFKKIFEYYEDEKKVSKKRDFTDMMLHGKDYVTDLGIKKLVVDEFQDMSDLRAKVCIQILQTNPSCRFFVVGDDAQSIYAFTGSKIEFISSDFDKNFGKSNLTHLNKTYRFSTEMAELSTKFVLQNEGQIPKSLEGVKQPFNFIPLQIINVGEKYIFNFKVRNIIYRKIEALLRKDSDIKKILFLGRYSDQTYERHIKWHTEFKNQINKVFRSKKHLFEFSTIHKVKGDEADYTFILHVQDKKWGFPSEMTDDKILDLVKENNMNLHEERRLFYVALTRAKKKVFMICNSTNQFYTEIISLDKIYHGRHYHEKLLQKVPNPEVSIIVKWVRSTDINLPICKGDKLISVDQEEFTETDDVLRYIRGKEQVDFKFERNLSIYTVTVNIDKEEKESGLVFYNLPFRLTREENNNFITQLTNKYNNSQIIDKKKTREIARETKPKIKETKKRSKILDDKQKIRNHMIKKYNIDIVVIQSNGWFWMIDSDAEFFHKRKKYKLQEPNAESPYKSCMAFASAKMENIIKEFLEDNQIKYCIIKKGKVAHSSDSKARGRELKLIK
tara:strand:+ start:435 stop:3341 length:2907 start_codon:yes stop_codon:yes gene_type:complete